MTNLTFTLLAVILMVLLLGVYRFYEIRYKETRQVKTWFLITSLVLSSWSILLVLSIILIIFGKYLCPILDIHYIKSLQCVGIPTFILMILHYIFMHLTSSHNGVVKEHFYLKRGDKYENHD